MRKEGFAAGVSMLFAFLATQHHNLHMLLFTLGMGSAGMGFMTHFPMIRRLMLAMSLIMAAVTVYQIWGKPRRMRIVGGVSAGLSVVLVVWSVYQFGL
jgi:hypothetical protein